MTFFYISLVCDTQATQARVINTLTNTSIKPVVNAEAGRKRMWGL